MRPVGTRRARRALTALSAALTLAAAPAPAHGAAVVEGDRPDPSVLRAHGAYWMVVTAKDWLPAFEVLRSRDLVHWTRAGAVLHRPPPGANGNFWAPELARWGAVYFSMSRKRGRPCIGVATARRPDARWRWRGLAHCPPAGAIDPFGVEDAQGRRWLAFKAFGVRRGIWIRRLRADGLRTTGPSRLLLAPARPWEEVTTEGPALVAVAGGWTLLYSGGHCCRPPCTYAVGAARAPALLGPYRRASRPLLRGGAGGLCPGHGTPVRRADGSWAYVHHVVAPEDDVVARRRPAVTPLAFDPAGLPRLGADGTVPRGPDPAHPPRLRARRLASGFQWLHDRPPVARDGGDGLVLRATGSRDRTRWVARQVPWADLRAAVRLGGDCGAAGLAVVDSRDRGIGIERLRDGRLRLWRGARGSGRTLARAPARSGPLRLEVRAGRRVRAPGIGEAAVARDARVVRIALTCAGARGGTARFGGLQASPLR